jgi:hypothetical protein
MIDLDVNRSQDKPSNDKFGDASLGMQSSITRRDFLGATLLLSPAQLLAQQPNAVVPGATEHWNGYGGVGEFAASNGNTWQVLSAGHKLRNSNAAGFLKNVTDTGELYDCVGSRRRNQRARRGRSLSSPCRSQLQMSHS